MADPVRHSLPPSYEGQFHMHVQALRVRARRMRDAIKAQGALGGSMSWMLDDGELLCLAWSGIDDHFEGGSKDGCRGPTPLYPTTKEGLMASGAQIPLCN